MPRLDLLPFGVDIGVREGAAGSRGDEVDWDRAEASSVQERFETLQQVVDNSLEKEGGWGGGGGAVGREECPLTHTHT